MGPGGCGGRRAAGLLGGCEGGASAASAEVSRPLLRRPTALLLQACDRPFDVVARDFSRNKYFDTKEAQEYGLIDQIVRPRRSAALGV